MSVIRTKPKLSRDAVMSRLVGQYRSAIGALVEGLAVLLHLPIAAHVVLNVATQFAISLVVGRRRHR